MNVWGDVMQELGALKARIVALESKASLTHDGRVVVDAKQVERWERIERAARTIISTIDEARTTASADFYAVIISGQFDRLVLGGLRKDLAR